MVSFRMTVFTCRYVRNRRKNNINSIVDAVSLHIRLHNHKTKSGFSLDLFSMIFNETWAITTTSTKVFITRWERNCIIKCFLFTFFIVNHLGPLECLIGLGISFWMKVWCYIPTWYNCLFNDYLIWTFMWVFIVCAICHKKHRVVA